MTCPYLFSQQKVRQTGCKIHAKVQVAVKTNNPDKSLINNVPPAPSQARSLEEIPPCALHGTQLWNPIAIKYENSTPFIESNCEFLVRSMNYYSKH